MSRIIVHRHDNGEERVVVGWDRPLGSFFAHEYDDEGECVRETGMGAGVTTPTITDTEALAFEAGRTGIAIPWSPALRDTLKAHTKLEYPESNVTVEMLWGQP